MIISKQIQVSSEGKFDVINITDKVKNFVEETGIQEGHALVYFKHTTGAVIIGEHEAGILADLKELLERITPVETEYKHHIREVDFNGHAHLRAALMQTSVMIPIIDGQLTLGKFQEILIIDDQVDQEPRTVIFQASGN